MSNQNCFLCNDTGAQATPSDHGNTVQYSCPSAKCGDYEITLRSMKLLEDNTEQKAAVMKLAEQCHGNGKFVDIEVKADGSLSASIEKF